ncbi:coenzyme F420-0:L-glutamate ligase [Actinoplanes solisilvae]|uniref:coenzyme F420-0:L-glutamate ligase n=1 Tax=Actinoplanes solisilvae TaxID=2486853 RepID=UPI000FD738C2|nr:coenzyme F420-0:L-glutamate ligase [Actinoplanes solisilvae]
MTDGLEILPVRGIGDIGAGDDLAELITAAAPWLADGDVLVVTSKIVSKAEGRLVEVPAAEGPERDRARAAVLESESARVVARRGPTTIVQTHHGFVMAAAGIDASNVDPAHLVLLPADPDASARRLRADFQKRGLDVAVIISDTMGRAWRNGLTDVALGSAGIDPIRDHRGEKDPYGNQLEITQTAVVDELSAAAELVKGKVDQVPVAVVRGYFATAADDTPGASVLLRDAASDMFSLGTAEARAEGLRLAAQLPDGPLAALPGLPVDLAAIERALDSVRETLFRGTTVSPAEVVAGSGATAALNLSSSNISPVGLLRLGADAHRVRAALAAESIATLSLPHQNSIRLELSGT